MQWLFEKVKTLIYYLGWTAAIIALAIIILLYLFQNALIYMPVIPGMSRYPQDNPTGYKTPKCQGLDYQDLQVVTPDGTKLHGWFVPCEDRRRARTVIYYHENAGNIGARVMFIREYVMRTDSNVVLVAYRGYSNSEGKPSEKGLQEDSLAILKHVKEQVKDIDKNKIYLHGRSLGGAAAVYAASHTPTGNPRGVILENTFTSMSDMVDVVFKHLKVVKHLILRNYWRTIDLIDKVQAPVMFIKSKKDELVPYDHMNKLSDALKKTDRIFREYVMENATHNETWSLNPVEYFSELNSFFKQCQASG